MLERSIQWRDMTFNCNASFCTEFKSMVETTTPKLNYKRNLQYSFSMDERGQSNDIGMSSMQEPLASLSLDSEQAGNKSI